MPGSCIPSNVFLLACDCIGACVFHEVRAGSYIVITKTQFVSAFRSRLATTYGAVYIYRRGGATWAFRAGVPGELIQIYGDWA